MHHPGRGLCYATSDLGPSESTYFFITLPQMPDFLLWIILSHDLSTNRATIKVVGNMGMLEFVYPIWLSPSRGCDSSVMSHSIRYGSFWKQSSQPITWLVQKPPNLTSGGNKEFSFGQNSPQGPPVWSRGEALVRGLGTKAPRNWSSLQTLLQILTAETIKIWTFHTIYLLIRDQ